MHAQRTKTEYARKGNPSRTEERSIDNVAQLFTMSEIVILIHKARRLHCTPESS